MKAGSRWANVTPRLAFVWFVYSWGNVLYGLDTGSFGSLQALPSWLNEFGVANASGAYVLPTERRSIMNSVNWIGKALGCILFEPFVSFLGYKKLMFMIVMIQFAGVIIELCAKDWIVFSVGRVFAYLAVGFIENACPGYQAEVTPAPLRGFVAGSLILLTTFGNVWGGLMSRAFQFETGRIGWLIPTAMQLIPPLVILIGLPFTPESPRWLVLHGKNDEALVALNKLRHRNEVDSGMTMREIQAFDQAIEEDKLQRSGGWLDLTRGNYRRRTLLAMGMFIFQQTSGGQFVLSYGPTFYVQMGLGAMAFTYNVVLQSLAFFACLITIFFLDKIGRRPILVVGAFMQVPFMLLVAGLGTKANPSQNDINGMIASIMLFNICVKVSLSTGAYLLASEIGGTRMRKKIMSVATLTDVAAACVVTYTIPYLLGTAGYGGVNLGANVGWIFAGISFLSFIFVTFFIPELAGRSLEEVDELFGQNLWAWQFKGYKATGVGAQIAGLERGDYDAKHGDQSWVEQAGDSKDLDIAVPSSAQRV